MLEFLETGTVYPSRAPEFTLGLWWGPSCSSVQFSVLLASTWVHPRSLVGSVLFICLVFCVAREYLGSPSVFGGVRLVHLFSFLCCSRVPGFTLGLWWGPSCSSVQYSVLLASTWVHPRSLVGSILFICLVFCVVLVFFFFILCLVCPVLSVSLDCPFLIGPSVFSNVCLTFQRKVDITRVLFSLGSLYYIYTTASS